MMSRRAFSQPTVIAAVYVGVHLIPIFWPSSLFWGFDFLFYFPVPVQCLFVLLSVLLIAAGYRNPSFCSVRTLMSACWGGEGCGVWLTRSLVIMLSVVSFVAFSSAHHFLGDGYILVGKLETDTWPNIIRAPFSYTVIRTLHDAGATLWTTAENSYRIYSYASGALYVMLAFPLAAAIGKNYLEKSIVLAFLLTAGYLQLFFGYVEHYALYMPVLILYIFVGLRAQERGLPVVFPAVVLGFLLALHQAFAVFGPSLLVLAYLVYRNRSVSLPTWKNAIHTGASLCCVPLSLALFLGLSNVGFDDYFSRMGGRNFLPLFAEPGLMAQYRIFSFAHFLDFSNQQLLAAPAACMTLLLLRKRAFRRRHFLFAGTFVPLLFTFIANPEIGAFRDWDVMSLPALPFTVWAASAFIESTRDREKLFRSASVICGAAALHSTLWIGLNTTAGAAEARFVHLLEGLTGSASVNGWSTMAEFERRRGNVAAANQAYGRTIDADPTNPNRWLVVGNHYRTIGQDSKAIEHYEKAAKLQPELPMPYMNLGAAYSDIRQFDKAIEYTRKAIALQPDNATAHVNLGAIYSKAGQVAKSIEHLEIAAALRPDHADTYGILGAMYREAGKYKRAIAALKKAVTIRPEDAIDCLNLGVVYYDVGQFDNAIEYLGKALEINPGYVLAYTNIGNAYKRQGKYPLAIGYFEKALELQTGRSQFQTFMAIGHTYYEMGEHEKAIPHFRKAVGLNPNHANAHLLLGLTYQKLNRGDRAKVHFEKTLELEPEHPQADQIKLWIEGVGEGRV